MTTTVCYSQPLMRRACLRSGEWTRVNTMDLPTGSRQINYRPRSVIFDYRHREAVSNTRGPRAASFYTAIPTGLILTVERGPPAGPRLFTQKNHKFFFFLQGP
jgi:hypothetical protein